MVNMLIHLERKIKNKMLAYPNTIVKTKQQQQPEKRKKIKKIIKKLIRPHYIFGKQRG